MIGAGQEIRGVSRVRLLWRFAAEVMHYMTGLTSMGSPSICQSASVRISPKCIV